MWGLPMQPHHAAWTGWFLGALCTTTLGALPPAEHVTFPAADGMRLAADYYAPGTRGRAAAPCVILLHMYRADRTSWAPLLPALHEAGFAVLAVDLRGHGESATTRTRQQAVDRDPQLFRDMQQDVRGAYDWIVQQPDIDRARCALVGASVGCSVALQYAVCDRSVDAIVGLSPGLNYMDIDSAGDLRQVTGRKILLVATTDEKDAPYTLRDRGGGQVDVRIISGRRAHGTDLFDAEPALAQDLAQFLKNAVGPATTTTVYGTIESNIYHQAGSAWIERIAATNLRHYSSPQEAEARGLRAARSRGPREREPATRASRP